MFSENLHKIYKEIFYLTTIVGFTAEYVEAITPAERSLYWQYYEEQQSKEAQAEAGEQTFNALSPDLPEQAMRQDTNG